MSSRIIGVVRIATAGVLLAAACSGGCTSYTNVPGPDNLIAGQDPNGLQASSVTETALRWVVNRHPVDGSYLLNLPVGTSSETGVRIVRSLGGGAGLPTSVASDLPTYHVTRVWIRFSDAKVDVVYPGTRPDGTRYERGVTVWLHAGVRPWTVSRGQHWTVGTIQTPAVWVPRPAADLEADRRAERRAAEQAERAAHEAERRAEQAERDAEAAEHGTQEPVAPAPSAGNGTPVREVDPDAPSPGNDPGSGG